MIREIGSNFWISSSELMKGNTKPITPYEFNCIGSDYVWMSTGRSALSFVIDTITKRNPANTKIVLIPSFTCHTVIEPFIFAGYKVEIFSIDINLCASGDDLLKIVKQKNVSVVLLHRYFGFETIINLSYFINEVKKLGVIIIDDITQCLFSKLQFINADYIVCSVRKWLGIPDGGFAVCAEGVFLDKPINTDDALLKVKIEASLLKYNYLFHNIGSKRIYLSKFEYAEELLDNQKEYFLIGDFSLKVLSRLDMDKLKTDRRMNYQHLLDGLRGLSSIELVFKDLPRTATPLYCPVRTKNRKFLQSYLAKNDIYAPIIWPKSTCLLDISNETQSLYEELLCLPIDQRYGICDMNRIIECIGRFYEEGLS